MREGGKWEEGGRGGGKLGWWVNGENSQLAKV